MVGEEHLQEYYADDARRLHRVVDRILSKFGGLYQKDRDDFYSLANEVLAGICRTYDGTKNFDGYVYSCLSNRIKTEMTRLNREKRRADRLSVSIDMPLGDEENRTIKDILVADFDMERELKERSRLTGKGIMSDGTGFLGDAGMMDDEIHDESVAQYLNGLSKIQRQIVALKMDGVSAREIQRRLRMTGGQYERQLRQLKSFDSTRMLVGKGVLSGRGAFAGRELLAGRKRLAERERLTGRERLAERERLVGSERLTGRERLTERERLAGKEIFAGSSMVKRIENRQSGSKEEETAEVIAQTIEKSKQKSYSISSIIRKMDSYTFRFDHPAQREAEQWSPKMKGNLISDILQDNPIPALVFAEQIVDGMVITWNLDGKQKCTNVYEFYQDGFRVSRNVRRWLIRYQTVMRDKDGKIILKGKELPRYEWKECDIRGKKYSELPVELQERFCDYTFEVTQYLNCSGDDISYHIARYNEGKPMTQSQKGMAYLGEEFASMVKSISCMDFFKDQGGYKISEFRNGTINRVVVESIMACNFLEDWSKQQEEMCDYIKENATVTVFEQFEELVERLSRVVNEDTAEMFDSKDSFLWFGLFARFAKLGRPDEQFVEFMDAFWIGLHEKDVDGVSFDDLNGKSTKDRNVVIGKMRQLERLMMEFLDEERKW